MIPASWRRIFQLVLGTTTITALVFSTSSCTNKVSSDQTSTTCVSGTNCADGEQCVNGKCSPGTPPPNTDCGVTPNGGTEARECYTSATVPYGAACTSTTQTRTCDHGAWNPDFPACANLTCAATAGCEMPAVPNNAVNVKNHGAKGDGKTDDTAAIKAAVAAVGAGGTVYVPDGTYLVKIVDSSCHFTSITLKSNMTFLMSANAIIKALPNSCPNYAILLLRQVDNVVIAGGTIEGERNQHANDSGEWGAGIELDAATNVTIKRVTVRDCWGDGIYIGSYERNSNGSKNVTVCNVLLDNNQRCNIAVVAASGVALTDSVMRNANGKNPQSGFCGEPNPPNDKDPTNGLVENVTISNCQMISNHIAGGYFGGIAPAISRNSIVKNCVIKNNGSSGFQIMGNLAGKPEEVLFGPSGIGNLLQDNLFEENGWTNPNPQGYTAAIQFNRAQQNTAKGNIFRHNAFRSFSMEGSSDNLVTGNTFIDNDKEAFWFRWYSHNNQVIDNTCQGTTPIIRVDSLATGNTISDNTGCNTIK